MSDIEARLARLSSLSRAEVGALVHDINQDIVALRKAKAPEWQIARRQNQSRGATERAAELKALDDALVSPAAFERSPENQAHELLRWSGFFTQAAKELLEVSTWRVVKDRANELKEQFDRACEFKAKQQRLKSLSQNERLVWDRILTTARVAMPSHAVWDRAVTATELTRTELDAALEGLKQKRLAVQVGDKWMRVI